MKNINTSFFVLYIYERNKIGSKFEHCGGIMRSQNKPKYNVKDWLRYNGSLYCIVLRYEDVDRPGVYAYSIAPNITEHPTTDELEDKFVFERGIDRHMELIEDEEQLREDIENGIYDLDFMSW